MIEKLRLHSLKADFIFVCKLLIEEIRVIKMWHHDWMPTSKDDKNHVANCVQT